MNESTPAPVSPAPPAKSAALEAALQWVRAYRASYDTYQNHKENIAHAAIVLQCAMAGWVLSRTEPVYATSQAKYALVLVWLVIHFYTRRQLTFKQVAVAIEGGCWRVEAAWIIEPPQMDGLKPQGQTSRAKASSLMLVSLWLFPWPARLEWIDPERWNDIPRDVANSIREHEMALPWGYFVFDWMLCIVSWLLLVMMMAHAATLVPK